MDVKIINLLQNETLNDQETIKKLEETIRQRTLLLNYYKRKVRFNESIIAKQKQLTMAIEIKKLDDTRYSVGGKEVRKDMDGDWVTDTSSSELTEAEIKAFVNHIRSVEKQ